MPDLTEPVFLSDPLDQLDPVPHPGCEVCGALGQQREAARTIGDLAAMVDCNVEIRRHPHQS